MLIKISYLLGYIKIYLYKIIYRNKLKFKHVLRISKDIKIDILEKSKLIIGKEFHCRRGISFRIQGNGMINIGDRTFFNDGVMLTCLNNITIGNDVRIGQNVLIYDHDHNYKEDRLIYCISFD